MVGYIMLKYAFPAKIVEILSTQHLNDNYISNCKIKMKKKIGMYDCIKKISVSE